MAERDYTGTERPRLVDRDGNDVPVKVVRELRMPDDDTVPVRRETLRVLIEGTKRWHDYTVDFVTLPDRRYEQAVREAEAQLRGGTE